MDVRGDNAGPPGPDEVIGNWQQLQVHMSCLRHRVI
jgi:hypothetical protein